MSGLEITGVVLGAVPLLVSALEHYGDGIRTMKQMRNYDIIFEDYSTQLNASIVIYSNSCYELLKTLNLPENQMEALMSKTALLSEQRAEAWSDASLQKALKDRLGDDHSIYASLQKKLNKRILLLGQKLKLEQNGKLPWIASDGTIDEKARRNFFKSLWWKTAGGFNTERYGTLLAEIDRDIEKLSKLASGAIQLGPITTKKRDRLQSAHWQDIRDQAQRIYDKLSVSFSPCACTHLHQANLRLDFREKHGPERVASRFAFLLAFEKVSHLASSPPWDWRDIEIECSRSADKTIAAVTPQIQTSGNTSAKLAPSISVYPPKQSPEIPSSSSVRAEEISSLCRLLVAARGQDSYLGILKDDFWQHHIYSVTGPATKSQISETVSLYELIHCAERMATRQKCTLALTLATSVLQLHDTPWLPRTWNTKNIFLLKNPDGGTISSQFYTSQTFTSASQTPPAVKDHRLVKNQVVFNLGVALLELAYGSSIFLLQEPQDLGEDGRVDSMTELTIATRLAWELNKHESDNYARAVLRCIICSFDTFVVDFNDAEFREAFYQAVVVPLQEDYRYVTRGKT